MEVVHVLMIVALMAASFIGGVVWLHYRVTRNPQAFDELRLQALDWQIKAKAKIGETVKHLEEEAEKLRTKLGL